MEGGPAKDGSWTRHCIIVLYYMVAITQRRRPSDDPVGPHLTSGRHSHQARSHGTYVTPWKGSHGNTTRTHTHEPNTLADTHVAERRHSPRSPHMPATSPTLAGSCGPSSVPPSCLSCSPPFMLVLRFPYSPTRCSRSLSPVPGRGNRVPRASPIADVDSAARRAEPSKEPKDPRCPPPAQPCP